MTEQLPLIPDDELTYVTLTENQKVYVQTIWGDEMGTVLEAKGGMAKIALERGDLIYISTFRVVPRDE